MSNNPALFPDFSKLMMGFDHTKMNDELTKMLAQCKVPGVNMDALVASQRENLQALTTANNAAMEAVQAVGKCQVKILQETMNEISQAATALTKAGSPQDVVAKQSELANNAFKAALINMLELAEIVTDANQKAINAISTRIPQSLDEIKDVLQMRQ